MFFFFKIFFSAFYFFSYFQSIAILKILMIASKRSYQYLSETIPYYLKHLFLDLWILILMRKHWIYVSIIWQFFLILARFGDLVNSNICITKIHWNEFNFLSKCDKIMFTNKHFARSLWKYSHIPPHIPCIISGCFRTKRRSVWFQMNRKMVNTNWFLFN